MPIDESLHLMISQDVGCKFCEVCICKFSVFNPCQPKIGKIHSSGARDVSHATHIVSKVYPEKAVVRFPGAVVSGAEFIPKPTVVIGRFGMN